MNDAPPHYWSWDEAVELCRIIESFCPEYGCHVALTGGCLYKEGQRKDCDILFYRIRQSPGIDILGLIEALAQREILKLSGFGWCYKFSFNGRNIDAFFPEEEEEGEYSEAPPEAAEQQNLELDPFVWRDGTNAPQNPQAITGIVDEQIESMGLAEAYRMLNETANRHHMRPTDANLGPTVVNSTGAPVTWEELSAETRIAIEQSTRIEEERMIEAAMRSEARERRERERLAARLSEARARRERAMILEAFEAEPPF